MDPAARSVEPMEVDPVPGHKLHYLVVGGLNCAHGSDKFKLEKHLQRICKTLRLGEVQSVSWLTGLGMLQVKIACSSDEECVKCITMEIDKEPHRPVSNGDYSSIGPRSPGIHSAEMSAMLDRQSKDLPMDFGIHCLLVRGLTVNDKSLTKIKPNLKTLCEELKLGMVQNVSFGKDPSSLVVEFICSSGKDCVKNITLQLYAEPYLPASIGTLHPTQSPFDKPQMENGDQQHPGSHLGLKSGRPGEQPKFLMLTTVELDLRAVEYSLREKVVRMIEANNFKTLTTANEKIRIEGVFEDVARFHQEVIDLFNNRPGEQMPPRKEQGAWGGRWAKEETMSRDPAPSKEQGARGALVKTMSRDPAPSEEEGKNKLRLSLFHYEYLTKVCTRNISAIKESHKVDILPEVILSFIDRGQGGLPREAKAQEAFTRSTQPLIADLGRVKVTISESERPNVAKAFREIQAKNPFFILEELDEDYAITGPRDGLERVKGELISLLKTGLKGKATLKIRNEMTATFKALEIPKGHWEVLEILFKKELDSIRSKYQVEVEQHIQSSRGNVQILVKNQNGTLDLSGNALQAFVSLYQRAVISYAIRAVDSNYRDRVRELFEKMQSSLPGVKLIAAKGGDLSLIGLSQDVGLAVRNIQRQLGDKVFLSLPGDLGEAPGQPSSRVAARESQATASSHKDEENCCICLDTFTNKTTLKCTHSFCKECWEQVMATRPQCPICNASYGKIEGNQPDGTMTSKTNPHLHLPGFEYQCGTIEIDYVFPSGTQSKKHAHPGQPYVGTTRHAYLPDNTEGREVLRLLKKAFEQKLIFTIGDSRTTGYKNVVTWNDIHHKTSTSGGPTMFGYPDPDYLKRVKEELKAKGIQ